ncbi:hypothetical protein [Bacillus sonorensis]|uniref:hypothetical protein n=1 Tax=Bacillus sonorensis TaxID=119858 RepID=UPI002282F50A|nr:hypothetical protein [Bacillus sonorensis]MCY8565664.1 hypothetical protein [Bacillus sonorensis]
MEEIKSEKFKLIGIKTKSHFLISDNVEGERYFYSRIKDLLFDGEKAKKTYHSDWYELAKEPTVIEEQVSAKKINQRYELKEGFQESELTPQVIFKSYIDEDSEFYEVKGLYEFKFDEEPQTNKIIDFEINVIEEIDGDLELDRQDFQLKHSLLDRILTHPLLLQTKPCSLTKEDSYKIIRNHVKANIDPKYARVTSDYDFCFTVHKVLELYQPYEYEVNINKMFKRRKPKFEKRMQKTREVEIYNVAPKPYQNYNVVEPFSGENLTDLKANIKAYLDELMEKINEPLVECKCCKGKGVILNEN